MKNLLFKLFFIYIIFNGVLFNISFGTDLKITEIYFKGSNEWIEITSFSGDYIGDIYLSGFKSKEIKISDFSINSGESVIIIESNTGKYDYILYNKKIFLPTYKNFSISDNITGLNFKLLYSGGIFTGYISQNLLSYSKINNSSIQLVFSGNNYFWTGISVNEVFNVSGDILANPGKILFYNQNINSQSGSDVINENNIIFC